MTEQTPQGEFDRQALHDEIARCYLSGTPVTREQMDRIAALIAAQEPTHD